MSEETFDEFKARIDSLTVEQLLRKVRYDPAGHSDFTHQRGEYTMARLSQLRSALREDPRIKINWMDTMNTKPTDPNITAQQKLTAILDKTTGVVVRLNQNRTIRRIRYQGYWLAMYDGTPVSLHLGYRARKTPHLSKGGARAAAISNLGADTVATFEGLGLITYVNLKLS